MCSGGQAGARMGDCGSEMSDCSSSVEEAGPRRNLLTIRLDRRARRLESNNRERRRMHELNAAFQVTERLEILGLSIMDLCRSWA